MSFKNAASRLTAAGLVSCFAAACSSTHGLSDTDLSAPAPVRMSTAQPQGKISDQHMAFATPDKTADEPCDPSVKVRFVPWPIISKQMCGGL